MFGTDTEEILGINWDWGAFQSTEGFPVSPYLLDWVVGQQKPLEECRLVLDEWAHKLSWIKDEGYFEDWADPDSQKQMKKQLPPGPYLLLLGDPGTGKSLIGRAMTDYLAQLYQKLEIQLTDVLCWQNEIVSGEPKISIHPAGEGKAIEIKEKIKGNIKKKAFTNTISGVVLLCMLVGFIAIGLACGGLLAGYTRWFQNPMISVMKGETIIQMFLQEYYKTFKYYMIQVFWKQFPSFSAGASMFLMSVLILFFRTNLLRGGGRGVGGTQRSDAPKILVDNSRNIAPFIDATGHGSSQLFGSIAWDPYQTGGLGCYDVETLALTKNGLKSYTELAIGDLVLAFNPITECIEEKRVQSIHVYPYEGNMYHYYSKQYDLFVTPNHKMLIKPYNKLWKEIEAENIDIYAFKIPMRGKWNGTVKKDLRKLIPISVFHKHNTNLLPPLELGDLLELIGWWVAEGNLIHNRKYIMINNLERQEKILQLLDKMELKYTVYKGEIIIPYNQLYSFFKEKFIFGSGRNKKIVPFFILDYPSELLYRLFIGLMHGDGSKSYGKYYAYYTSNEKIRDFFLNLVMRLGFHCTYTSRFRGERKIGKRTIQQHYPSHQVLIQRNSQGYIEKSNWQIKDYSGYVWCPVIEDLHNLLVVRNGKLAFSGNTPEHQRVVAGDVHRAHLGILYIDEIKNLKPVEAITLLTVLEDGQLPVANRGDFRGSGSAAMAVATDPVPCLTLLLAAGNFDSINQIHPALMDRIYGYGRVVRMNNDMPNTRANRRKYVQFIAQEAQRFHLPSFSRRACEAIVNEGRRRSGKRGALTNKFRPLISIVKTAAQLAINDKSPLVKHIHVSDAINEHCKTIQRQILEHQIEERGKFLEINPKGVILGQTYGLAVVADKYSGEKTGVVARVTAYLKERNEIDTETKGFYKVTGIAKDGTWIDDSVAKVRSVILKRYGIDIAQQYFTHIDFAQSHGVDGPSAGVTMTVLLCSLIEGRPIRQDTAMTGEINVGATDEVLVTAIGGTHEKISAAQSWGFKKVLIPKKNLDHSITPRDYKLEVKGCSNLDEYLNEILVKGNDNE